MHPLSSTNRVSFVAEPRPADAPTPTSLGPRSSTTPPSHTPCTDAPPTRHLLPLDGLRGLAILLVLLDHFFLFESKYPWPNGLQHLFTAFANGWVGVDLFFVLSGFLITGILLDAKATPHFFRNFYMRRTLRIFPLYYATLFAVLILAPLFASALHHPPKPLPYSQAWYWLYGTNFYLTLAQTWDTQTLMPLGHFWSLAVEEHFYLAWPLIVWAFSPKTLTKICLVVIPLVILARIAYVATTLDARGGYMLTPFRIDALLIGGLAQLLYRAPRTAERVRRWSPRLVLALLPVILLGLTLIRWDVDFPRTALIPFPFLDLFFAALLLTTLTQPAHTLAPKLFSHSALRFFGRYSYGLYVFHPFVQKALEYHRILTPLNTHLGNLAGLLVDRALILLLSIAIALLSFHLFEAPFLKLKRFFH